LRLPEGRAPARSAVWRPTPPARLRTKTAPGPAYLPSGLRTSRFSPRTKKTKPRWPPECWFWRTLAGSLARHRGTGEFRRLAPPPSARTPCAVRSGVYGYD